MLITHSLTLDNFGISQTDLHSVLTFIIVRFNGHKLDNKIVPEFPTVA